MNLFEITKNDIEVEVMAIHSQFSFAFVGWQNAFSIQGGLGINSVSDGINNYCCALELELYELLQFAKGEIDLPYAYDMCQAVCELIWTRPFDDTFTVEWEKWTKTAVGTIVRASYARIDLEAGVELSAPEIAILSGMSRSQVNRATGTEIQGTRQKNGTYSYAADEVLKYIESKRQVKK